MSHYRLYFMHPGNGHIDRLEEFDATSDSAALLFASGKTHAQPMELWHGNQKLRRFDEAPLNDALSHWDDLSGA